MLEHAIVHVLRHRRQIQKFLLKFKKCLNYDYYNEEDLGRFGEIAKYKPELFEKFLAWYQACQEEGALSKREKALIGLAVAVTVQCPYCIEAFTNSSLENGSNMEQMTEAMHLASAIRGGASLIHGIQSHNAHDKVSM